MYKFNNTHSLILLQGGKGYIDMGENSIFFFFIICK